MKKGFFLLVAFLPLYWACNNDDTTTDSGKGENDVDAAGMFIRSALDGRWKDAKRLIVQDSANIQDLEVAEQNYTQRMNVTDQRGYRESQITIHNTRKVSDSISIITYSNTFKKQRDSVKVVRIGNQWLVDLKYSFPNTNAVQQ
jgi:hypothetical protein